jgi:DNA-binding transcriptional regulator YhcF (GntR family)
MTNRREENQGIVDSAIRLWYANGKTYGPSYRDLAAMTGLALGTVFGACQDLRHNGVISFEDGTARTIRMGN